MRGLKIYPLLVLWVCLTLIVIPVKLQCPGCFQLAIFHHSQFCLTYSFLTAAPYTCLFAFPVSSCRLAGPTAVSMFHFLFHPTCKRAMMPSTVTFIQECVFFFRYKIHVLSLIAMHDVLFNHCAFFSVYWIPCLLSRSHESPSGK